MRPCVVPQSKLTENIAVGKIAKWPARLNTPSDRLKLVNKKVYAFKEDTKLWQQRMSHYKNLWADLRTKQIRNVMDMYTEFGGFGAALINSDVWVMNVVSSYSANTLGIVYDRGLIGAVHDWYLPPSPFQYFINSQCIFSSKNMKHRRVGASRTNCCFSTSFANLLRVLGFTKRVTFNDIIICSG